MEGRKMDQDLDDEDEDDVPLAVRMSKNAAKGPPSDPLRSSIDAARKIFAERKKAKMDGLAGMANLSSNGAAAVLKGTPSRVVPSPSEGQDRMPGHKTVEGLSPVERKRVDKVVAPPVGNSARDSDDSDDDKPLSHRKFMAVPGGKGSQSDDRELKDALSKKRPAGQIGPSVTQTVAKRIKTLAAGQSSPKLHSPRPAIKREADSGSMHGTRKADPDDDEDDDLPLAQRISKLSSSSSKLTISKKKASVKVERDAGFSSEDDDHFPLAKRAALSAPGGKIRVASAVKKPSAAKSIAKRALEQRRKGKSTAVTISKQVVKSNVTKQSTKMIVSGGTQKWETLEHSGVIFPPPYQPHGVKMIYKGKPVTLTPEQEEVATMFAVMKDTDYASKPKFIENFWADWKPILGPGHVIQNFEHCDFTPIYEWNAVEREKKKSLSSQEKKNLREEKLKAEEKYMWALVNGVKEKVGNFRVEPPGLFRGRGEHPKMGKLKKRIFPENIVINIGKGSPIPECPMPGHKWKEIRHDNTVTWLAFWNDPINVKEFKYVFLAPSSSLKGQSDMEKYEKARQLKDHIQNIRRTYTKQFNSADPVAKQIAVATYLIDRLALRAGNEKDEDEADTVGCCSLKVEHVILVPPKSLTFDFLGKDSIRYFNTVEVEEKVYKAIGDFKKGKQTGKDLFDRLDTSKLNAHLKGIMPALTAKVFRTYNASITLDNILQDTVGNTASEKVADYQRANKEVAILCNHQRTVSKSHSSQMERLEAKMTEAEDLIQELRDDLEKVRKGKTLKFPDGKPKKAQSSETLERKIMQVEQRVEKMKLDMRIKDDLKTVALGTSKINYMDPRITVAWCKRHEVPIEKLFNKSLLAKFGWAMDVEPDYRF